MSHVEIATVAMAAGVGQFPAALTYFVAGRPALGFMFLAVGTSWFVFAGIAQWVFS